MPIAYIGVRFFAHATEDPNKVVEAVQNILPSDYLDDITFSRRNLRGHFGNPITLYESKVRDRETIKAFVENLSTRLNESDKEILLREIGRRVEKGTLYLRLDKQAALQGELRLCTADPVRVQIRFRKTKLQDVIAICRQINLLKSYED